MDAFQSCLAQNIRHFQPDLLSMDEQWTALRDSLLSSGESVLGRCRRLQPDWYRDSCSTLDPLLEQRNQAYTAWVASGHQSDSLEPRPSTPAPCILDRGVEGLVGLPF